MLFFKPISLKVLSYDKLSPSLLTRLNKCALILMRSAEELTPSSLSTLWSASSKRSPSMPHCWKITQYLSSLFCSRKFSTECRGYCASPPCRLRRKSTWQHTRVRISYLLHEVWGWHSNSSFHHMYLDLESLSRTGDSKFFQNFLCGLQQHLPTDVIFSENSHMMTQTNLFKKLAHMLRSIFSCTLLNSLCVWREMKGTSSEDRITVW